MEHAKSEMSIRLPRGSVECTACVRLVFKALVDIGDTNLGVLRLQMTFQDSGLGSEDKLKR